MSDRDRYANSTPRATVLYPGFKEGVRMLNQWYNEGLIFRDFPLMKTADDFYNALKSGVAGAFSGNWDLPYRTDYKIIEDLRRNVPGADFVPVDCFQSSDGIARKDMYDKVGLQIFVPSSSKSQEAALKYLNWLCIKENYNFIQVGNEGMNHRLVNGIPEIITRPGGDPWIQNSSQNIDFTMPQNGIELGNQDMNVRAMAFSYGGYPADVIVNAYNLSTKNARAPVVVTTPTTKDGVYGQTITDKVDALLAQSIMGSAASFDATWDAGIRDIMASGGQEIIDERVQIASTIWK
jgi:putative aldouronate transport system substrate-binding protein